MKQSISRSTKEKTKLKIVLNVLLIALPDVEDIVLHAQYIIPFVFNKCDFEISWPHAITIHYSTTNKHRKYKYFVHVNKIGKSGITGIPCHYEK